MTGREILARVPDCAGVPLEATGLREALGRNRHSWSFGDGSTLTLTLNTAPDCARCDPVLAEWRYLDEPNQP